MIHLIWCIMYDLWCDALYIMYAIICDMRNDALCYIWCMRNNIWYIMYNIKLDMTNIYDIIYDMNMSNSYSDA